MPSPPQDAVLLVNTKSRRGEEWYGQVVAGLKQRGITLAHTEAFKKPKELLIAARRFAKEGRPFVFLGGGDGTFSGTAEAFSRSQSVIGVLPLGTGNAFARDLSIPTDVDAACDVIAEGNIEQVDMGLAGTRPFINVATVGLTAQIARNLNSEEKRILGPAAYALSLFRSLAKIRPFDVELTMNEETRAFRSLQVVVGN
ncbi:MAG: lipid kinase, partial [Armatimonadota bacterium]